MISKNGEPLEDLETWIPLGGLGYLRPDDPGGQAEEIFHQAKELIPEAEGVGLARHTIGWRPVPEDGFPVLGFSEGAPDVYVAVMHSGVTLAPLVGRLVASEILDGVQVEMLEPYRRSRFEV